jgi:hypothetical protein
MSARWLASAALVAAIVTALGAGAGCDRDELPAAFDLAVPGGGDGGRATEDGGAAACGDGIDSPPYEGANHVPDGSHVDYEANPPASGNHWPQWAEPWGAYPGGLPRERWLHNLEHGGVVLLYNCPSGCDDVVAELTALRSATPPDRFGLQRLLIVPDRELPTKVAAVAWLWRWQGDRVDAATLRCFIDARYDHAPESIP